MKPMERRISKKGENEYEVLETNVVSIEELLKFRERLVDEKKAIQDRLTSIDKEIKKIDMVAR
jgi:hypothetical protein